jgi:hypothetical protein
VKETLAKRGKANQEIQLKSPKTDIERNQSALNVAAMLDSFTSFQRCGPLSAPVIRLNDSAPPTESLKSETDWFSITKGRPVEDCRVSVQGMNSGMKKPALHLV